MAPQGQARVDCSVSVPKYELPTHRQFIQLQVLLTMRTFKV
jgi:hypothetical protein